MHLTLESFNHILTVIAVTGFLFSRENYFEVLFKTTLLTDINELNEVSELADEIDKSIPGESAEILQGLRLNIYDIEGAKYFPVEKLRSYVQAIKQEYSDSCDLLRNENEKEIKIINSKFKNTAFYIALVSFTVLIMAALWPHNINYRLNTFLLLFNICNIISLFIYAKKNTEIKNLIVLRKYAIWIFIISISTQFIPEDWYIYSKIFINEINWMPLQRVINWFRPDGFYHGVLFLTLVIILSPWIICLYKFNSKYHSVETKVNSIKPMFLSKLHNFKNAWQLLKNL